MLGDHWRYDIEAYVRAAGRLADEGSLYLTEQIEAPYVPGGKDYYHYSPPLGVALVPLSGLDEHSASVVWFVLKSLALFVACLLLPVRLPVRALTFVGVAVSFWAMRDLVLGNVGVLLVLPMAVAWRWLDRPLGSVALALTISVRPSGQAILSPPAVKVPLKMTVLAFWAMFWKPPMPTILFEKRLTLTLPSPSTWAKDRKARSRPPPS